MAIHRNQTGTIAQQAATSFRRDVLKGLKANNKHLHSKYFYDSEGDRLFREIMKQPEYYLTNCELEIFTEQSPAIAKEVLQHFREFDIIELGAGDAMKSSYFLQHLMALEQDFTYMPVDISGNMIRYLERTLPSKIEGIRVSGLHGEYFEMLHQAEQISRRPKLVLFLGSSIGNFSPDDAFDFLCALHSNLQPGDLLLIGIDLKKDPRTILAAYDDAAGITREFNLNMLRRINRELDANFDTNRFSHYPTYHPVTGACRSYLISKLDQKVEVAGHEISFRRHEPIYMELSQKYAVQDIEQLAANCGFRSVRNFFDKKEWFVDALWGKGI